MKDRRGIKTLGAIAAVLLGLSIPILFYLYFSGGKDQKPLPNAVRITNQSLPDSKLVSFEGDNISPKIREGKVLIIFLSSGCAACKKDGAIISKVYSELSSDIQIYGITIEKKEDIQSFVNENNIKFPILTDVNSELFKKLQIHYFPTKFLVKDGTIIETLFGNFRNEDEFFKVLETNNFK